MTLKLRVLQGTLKRKDGGTAGMEVVVPSKPFVIGSGDKCQMRCPSPSISPRHCQITPAPSGFTIRDLNSETGTFVNGERVTGERVLADGDQLRIGRLEFEVALEALVHSRPAPVADADPEGDKISDMLVAADEEERAQRLDDPAKRHFDVTAHEPAASRSEKPPDTKKLSRPPKRPPIKLPPPPKVVAEDTVHAAEEVLKKFFEKPKK